VDRRKSGKSARAKELSKKPKPDKATPQKKERKWRFANISNMAGVRTEGAKLYRQFMLGKLDAETATKATWMLAQHRGTLEAMQAADLQRAIEELEQRLASASARNVGPMIEGRADPYDDQQRRFQDQLMRDRALAVTRIETEGKPVQ
jgi:hypothetical protein